MGIDSTRSFYFALQQLSILDELNESLVKEPAVSLAENVDYLRRLRKLNGFTELAAAHARSIRPPVRSPLVEVARFGTNPGNLRMFAFVPGSLQYSRALVVVLHGCGQTA